MKNGGAKVVARNIQDKGCDRLVELIPELALFYGVGCVFRFAFLVSVLAGRFIMPSPSPFTPGPGPLASLSPSPMAMHRLIVHV